MSDLAPLPLLPPIPGLQFLEESHRYLYMGQFIPYSATKILSHDMTDHKRKRIEETKSQWEPRGNCVHQALEAFLTSKDVEMGEYGEWIEPLIAHPLWTKYQPLAVEHRLVDKKELYYAGSFDFLLKGTDGKIILGDLKTLARANSPTRSVATQLGAYLYLMSQWHPEIMVTRCMGVFSKPGKVELTVHEPQECLDAWMSSLDAHKSLYQPDF